MKAKSESLTFFKRKEKKFLVESETFFSIKKIFDDPNGKFEPDHLDLGTDFTYIENIYFDSPDLNSYHQAQRGEESRFKLRIRTYAQNFVKADDRIFFEVKSKENGETVKKRVAFKSEWLNLFLKEGRFPEGAFVLLNSDKKPINSLKILSSIYVLIRDLKYRPVLSSNYVRYAYRIKNSNSIRITIDRDLKFASLINDLPVLLPYQESIRNNQYVVEVKYLAEELLSEIPCITKFLSQSNKFSKYNFGIYRSYLKVQTDLEKVIPEKKTLPRRPMILSYGLINA